MAAEQLETRLAPAVAITLDYTYDTNNFFDTQAKKDLLRLVANDVAASLDDPLLAISPSGSNTWKSRFTHPGTGANTSITNPSIGSNEIVVFAGGRNISGLGIGGPGGWEASGSSAWLNTVAARGQTGALLAAPTDFGPWGGSLTFSTNGSVTWHFGSTTNGLEPGESDFYSVAYHELLHLLGIGTAGSWSTFVDAANEEFTGPASVAEYDLAGNPPLSSDLGHWANGTLESGQEVAMDPSLTNGTRKPLTALDYAGLVDVGWDVKTNVVMTGATANGSSTLSFSYDIQHVPATSFEVRLYLSSDLVVGSGDTLLFTTTISGAANLSVGPHTRSFTIGTDAGQIRLPGVGSVDLTGDYHLLASADFSGTLNESRETDNTAKFSGAYAGTSNVIYVHGTQLADIIRIEPTAGVRLTLNSTVYNYSSPGPGLWRIRSAAGDDRIDASLISQPIWVRGGDGRDSVTGGSGNDTLTGDNQSDTLIGGAGHDILEGWGGNDRLTGGDGSDTFRFDADVALGSDLLDEAGGGTDTLDFSLTSARSIVVNLGQSTAQVVNDHLTLTLGSGSTFEKVTGGLLSDRLTGNSLANQLVGREGDDTLNGAAGDDVYRFDADSASGNDVVADSSGSDTLDFSLTTLVPLAIDLGNAAPQIVHANLTLTLPPSDAIEHVAAGGMGDTITGNTAANTLSGGPGDDTIHGATGDDMLVGGGGDDSLVGGANDDTYVFDMDSQLGTDMVNESGGGIDTLDFSSTSGHALVLNLAETDAQPVSPNLTLILAVGNALENIVGGAKNDLIFGNTLANVLVGQAGNDTLVGSTGDDTYVFDVDSDQGVDTIRETGGVDTVDFSQTTSQGLVLNLGDNAAQVVHNTNLTLTLDAGSVLEIVLGGDRDDRFTANTGSNVLVGGAGDDTLVGGAGRDLLFGGLGADVLDGAATNDILIAGTTSYDNQLPALKLARTEWIAPTTYDLRTDHLRSGINGIQLTAGITVFDDASVDSLTGNTGRDWFFASAVDTVLDRVASEFVEVLV